MDRAKRTAGFLGAGVDRVLLGHLGPVGVGVVGREQGAHLVGLGLGLHQHVRSQGPRQSGVFSAYPLYVATPQLLRYLGVDPAAVSAGLDMVSPLSGDLTIENGSSAETITKTQRLSGPRYTSAPTSAMTLSGIARRHWTQIAAGWLVQSSKPITSAQIVEARHIAALAGLTIETRNEQRSLVAVRLGAAAVGVLLALGVLAMTVGLIRREAANDLRILVAAGAASSVRRMLTAATAGGLALLGVALGLLGAYLGLVAAYRDHLGTLSHVPVLTLLGVALCTPVAAFLAGWLLAGRQPSGIARSVMD